MPKKKSGAEILVADGAGGMRAVSDLRFQDGEWPIELVIPAKDAETWLAHLHAEIEEKGWGWTGIAQLEAGENSGSLSIPTSSGPTPPTIDIVWEKPRRGALHLRARVAGTPPPSLSVIRDLFDAINKRQLSGRTLQAHRRTLLTYDGLPWRGELWLNDGLRLGPPSKHPDTLLGPQVIVVDAMIEGIGEQGVLVNLGILVNEVRVFLSAVLGLSVSAQRFDRSWVYDVDEQGRITDCKIRDIGYVELSLTPEFPIEGSAPPMDRREVTRPGLGPLGITSDMNEEWVPSDIEELWHMFTHLAPDKREHFMRAGNAYLTARTLAGQRTAYVAFLVVTCEALKPPGKRYDDVNIYDVVASLVGLSEAEQLRRLSIHPQKVRSRHLHRGELAGGELLPRLGYDPFGDPSFDEMIRVLSRISRICLIEWLRRGGKYQVVRVPMHGPGVPS